MRRLAPKSFGSVPPGPAQASQEAAKDNAAWVPLGLLAGAVGAAGPYPAYEQAFVLALRRSGSRNGANVRKWRRHLAADRPAQGALKGEQG